MSAVIRPAAILAERAVHEHRPVRKGGGDAVEHPADLLAALAEHSDVEISDVGRRVERRWVLVIDHLVDERQVRSLRRLDEPGAPAELRLLSQIDHQRQVERLDHLASRRCDPDRIVRPEQTSPTYRAPVGRRPSAGVTEVDTAVDIDVSGSSHPDHSTDGTVDHPRPIAYPVRRAGDP